MSESVTFTGVVLKRTENVNKKTFLRLLTAEGTVSVYAPAAKSVKKEQGGLSQPFTYADFECTAKGDLYTLSGGSLRYDFYPIASDYSGFLLAQFVCDVADATVGENVDASGELETVLATFYAILQKKMPVDLIRATFVWRFLTAAGYAPDLDGCPVCRRRAGAGAVFDIEGGVAVCPEHWRDYCTAYPLELREGQTRWAFPLSSDALSVIRHCAEAPLKSLYAYSVSEEETEKLNEIAEKYLQCRSEKGYSSLLHYKERNKTHFSIRLKRKETD